MDHRGGIETQRLCYQKRLKVLKDRETSDDKIPLPPRVFVHGVRDAGHLLMLDNHDEFNAAVVIAAGGEDNLPFGFPRPIEFVCDEVIAAGDADLLPRGKREVFGEAAATQFFKRMRRFRNQAKEGVDVDVDVDEKKTEVA
jgi:hypothetical protein